jgi:hypothetical protein
MIGGKLIRDQKASKWYTFTLSFILLGEAIDKQLLITLMTIGYAGTDFIEGFMKKKLPQ